MGLLICNILLMLVCSFLVLLILLQESKGGGIAALAGGAADQTLGTRNPLREMTKWTAIIMVGLLIITLKLNNSEANSSVRSTTTDTPSVVAPVSGETKLEKTPVSDVMSTTKLDETPATDVISTTDDAVEAQKEAVATPTTSSPATEVDALLDKIPAVSK